MRPVLRSPLLRCSLLALALAGCGDSTGSSGSPPEPPEPPVPSADLFDTGSLESYTVYNTPGAWSMANGRLNAGPSAQQSVVIRNGETITDGWVETMTADADDGGLVLRFRSEGNYYLLAIRDDSWLGYANFELYRAVDGKFTTIAGPVDRAFPQGALRTVRFEAEGSRLRAYLDGVMVLQASDAAYTSGGFGLRHDNTFQGIGVTSHFDLLRWVGY